MEIIQGSISNISQETNITGATTTGNRFVSNTNVKSVQDIHFRVDNKPVHVKLDQAVNINNGEQVAVAGHLKNGTFKGFAIKNLDTNITYKISSFKIILAFIAGLVIIYLGSQPLLWGLKFVGLPLFSWIAIAVGSVFIVMATFFVIPICIKYFRANKLIEES